MTDFLDLLEAFHHGCVSGGRTRLAHCQAWLETVVALPRSPIQMQQGLLSAKPARQEFGQMTAALRLLTSMRERARRLRGRLDRLFAPLALGLAGVTGKRFGFTFASRRLRHIG